MKQLQILAVVPRLPELACIDCLCFTGDLGCGVDQGGGPHT